MVPELERRVKELREDEAVVLMRHDGELLALVLSHVQVQDLGKRMSVSGVEREVLAVPEEK